MAMVTSGTAISGRATVHHTTPKGPASARALAKNTTAA